LKTVYNLIIKDLIRLKNDKPALLLSFIVPMALIIIFGNIFGGGGPRGRVAMILVNESNSPVAKLIESKLDTVKSLYVIKTFLSDDRKDTFKIDEQKAIELIKSGKSSAAALIMPKDFFTDTSTALKFKFYFDPKNDIESALIQGTIQQTIMSHAPRLFPVLMTRQSLKFIGQDSTAKFISGFGKLIGEFFNVPIDSVIKSMTIIDSASLYSTSLDTASSANVISSLVKFENEQLVGKEVQNPGLTRTVGGWAIMFLLFSLTGAATSLFEEKQEGTLKRLLCMPVSRAHILWSKYIYSMLFGIFQLLVLFFFSWIIFNVEMFSNFLNLLIMITVSAAAAVSFGMLITSFAKSMNQAAGISTLFILTMSAVGGSWFPTSLLPDWMQTISKVTLTYWSVDGFLQVLWRQAPFSAIALNVLVLLTISLLINLYALVRFNNNKTL